MWFFYLLCHVWLSGSLILPFMFLVLWSGTKWTRLSRLIGTKKCWLLTWGCFAFVKTIALPVLSLARSFPDFEPFYLSGWAANAVWSALYTFRILNAPLGFVITFCLDSIAEISIACTFAALVWWVDSQLTRKEAAHSSALTMQRYGIALLCSACALGIANHIYARRPATCFDCFWPHGFPFTYFHEGGFAGGEGIVWSGVVGNAFVMILVGALLGWMWNGLPRKHPA
jgi:hypothetical protein